MVVVGPSSFGSPGLLRAQGSSVEKRASNFPWLFAISAKTWPWGLVISKSKAMRRSFAPSAPTLFRRNFASRRPSFYRVDSSPPWTRKSAPPGGASSK